MNKKLSKKKQILIKMLDYVDDFQIDDLLENIEENFSEDDKELKPKGKANHVGIEIECFVPEKRFEFKLRIDEAGLSKYVQVGDDGSIDVDCDESSMELRCLFKETELATMLPKLGKVLKQANAGVNDSCGLHVHLDMRNRKVDACYKKLLDFQDIMYGLVEKDRWSNSMCKFSDVHSEHQRYTAINKTAYKVHKTIEVRLHHGTIDDKVILNWVNLLLRAIGKTPVPKKVSTIKDALNWAGKDKAVRGYINKSFNKDWFVCREDVVLEGEGDYDDDWDY